MDVCVCVVWGLSLQGIGLHCIALHCIGFALHCIAIALVDWLHCIWLYGLCCCCCCLDALNKLEFYLSTEPTIDDVNGGAPNPKAKFKDVCFLIDWLLLHCNSYECCVLFIDGLGWDGMGWDVNVMWCAVIWYNVMWHVMWYCSSKTTNTLKPMQH